VGGWGALLNTVRIRINDLEGNKRKAKNPNSSKLYKLMCCVLNIKNRKTIFIDV
jgi:hypothetical protein